MDLPEGVVTPTTEEFIDWKNLNCTKYVRAMLEAIRQHTRDYYENGGTLNPNAILTSDYVVGKLHGLNDFLELQYEEEKKYDY